MVKELEIFAKNTIKIPFILRSMSSKAEEESYLSAWMKKKELSCFRIMTVKDGDKRITWCRRILSEIKAAKDMFEELISKGMVPYKVGIDGSASVEIMDQFDPSAEEVIFLPVKAISGG